MTRVRDLSFSTDPTKKATFVYASEAAKDGFFHIWGVVINHPDVKTVIFIFRNGTVSFANVGQNLFSYVGKPGTDNKPKQVIGVTTNGTLVQ